MDGLIFYLRDKFVDIPVWHELPADIVKHKSIFLQGCPVLEKTIYRILGTEVFGKKGGRIVADHLSEYMIALATFYQYHFSVGVFCLRQQNFLLTDIGIVGKNFLPQGAIVRISIFRGKGFAYGIFYF